MSKATFKRTLLRRAGADRPERKPLFAPAPPPRREYLEPSDEQLARFVAAVLFGAPVLPFQLAGARLALGDPETRAKWLREHRAFQRQVASLGTDPRTEPSREDGGRNR